jgi:hypothetical protein
VSRRSRPVIIKNGLVCRNTATTTKRGIFLYSARIFSRRSGSDMAECRPGSIACAQNARPPNHTSVEAGRHTNRET